FTQRGPRSGSNPATFLLGGNGYYTDHFNHIMYTQQFILTYVLRQFYFVNQSLNWTEAQTYCRQKYTDLVTIRNSEETNQLMNTLSSAGHSSEVWIGLFSEIDWRWSDGFTGSGAEYRNWRSESNEPNFISGKDLCVITSISGLWFDVKCSEKRQFICYKDVE
uniref:C-type lectin domain-containing protein n=1 Tax=Kryptolebias marmoratus TaxID=37003 RepID=A0A3Q3B2B4_KRYMA